MAITAIKSWHLHQLDVNITFLHRDINETIYIKPPPGLKIHKPGSDLQEILHIKTYLHNLFIIKDLGKLKYFLGMEDYGMLTTKLISDPMDYTTHLSKDSRTPLASTSAYCRIVRRLLHLTNTRPEICYAMSKLSEFLDSATDKYFQVALRVLRYLKGAPSMGLFFSLFIDLTPFDFSDSDWRACLNSRRSIIGYCFFLGTSIISYKSKKQDTISASSCEAEYRTLALETREAQWLRYMMKELQIDQQ
ncbi:uncharacterized mitochondrial protein AtMg00810-like [Arachis hypogaea]|uniref:uncharacterized mitochondrial protein AtMg00810-like n=1 Tax=Arachis hypogaea TaxID=3818 RepID=UPI000DEC96F2|nr:uncharacterized protein LOC112783760 [Arachis hypogaea]